MQLWRVTNLLGLCGLSLAVWLLLFPRCVVAEAEQEEPDKQPGARPRVLILGDSISIGYTPAVRAMLADEAVVIRPTQKNGRPENCAGTNNGIQHIDRWLKIDDGNWDLIHFNFGLHDLKRVDPETNGNSNNPSHPRQAEPPRYEKQLREIVAKLRATGAKMVFATTTPYPAVGLRPHRDADDAIRYNAIATKIMRESGVQINDLYEFALPKLKDIQRPANVHFTPDGSRVLAGEVTRQIRQSLKRKSTK